MFHFSDARRKGRWSTQDCACGCRLPEEVSLHNIVALNICKQFHLFRLVLGLASWRCLTKWTWWRLPSSRSWPQPTPTGTTFDAPRFCATCTTVIHAVLDQWPGFMEDANVTVSTHPITVAPLPALPANLCSRSREFVWSRKCPTVAENWPARARGIWTELRTRCCWRSAKPERRQDPWSWRKVESGFNAFEENKRLNRNAVRFLLKFLYLPFSIGYTFDCCG